MPPPIQPPRPPPRPIPPPPAPPRPPTGGPRPGPRMPGMIGAIMGAAPAGISTIGPPMPPIATGSMGPGKGIIIGGGGTSMGPPRGPPRGGGPRMGMAGEKRAPAPRLPPRLPRLRPWPPSCAERAASSCSVHTREVWLWCSTMQAGAAHVLCNDCVNARARTQQHIQCPGERKVSAHLELAKVLKVDVITNTILLGIQLLNVLGANVLQHKLFSHEHLRAELVAPPAA
eukprot:364830-Chlamydomonas_euryale.AAC.6